MSKFPHLLKKNTPNGTFMFLYVDKPDYEFKEMGSIPAPFYSIV